MNMKTRKQHRRMLEELQKLVDKACDSGRLFFERKRDRKYRIRRSHRAEILQNHLLSRAEFDGRLPPGLAWFVAVKNLCDGVRLRAFVPPFGRDLTDEDARQIMHNVTGFFGVLAEWARAEKMAFAASNNASPKEGEARHDR
jgi:hypothetical protein